MGSVTERPPIWLLPRPLGSLPVLGTGRPRLALALAVVGLVALAPAFAFLAPASRWNHQWALILLVVFSFYAYVGATHLRGTATLDAAFVAALLGVALLGPLAGALIFAAPELTRLASDRRLTSTLGNLASFGWATLVAGWTLELLGYGAPAALGTIGSYAAVAVAGLVLVLVNYLYITILSEVVKEGIGLWLPIRRELVPTMPVNVVLLAAAALTAFLYTELGVAGLAPLAGVVFIPRLLVPLMMRDIPVSDLSVPEATARYADGLANMLGLSATQRRVLRDAATHLGGSARLTRLDDFGAVMRAVLYSHESWNGHGRLGLLSGSAIPIESRVLAVASAWAQLTAQNGHGLTPRDALVHLRARAGEGLDPKVVAAAVRIVDGEIIELGRSSAETAAAPIAA